jgi:poly-gamma-glutamate synthesis protein (capsule biosynthesis protein)
MHRRHFLALSVLSALSAAYRSSHGDEGKASLGPEPASKGSTNTVKLFLCGDIMTGRGIDQILPNAGSPELYEPYVSSATDYVRLAEQTNGPIPRGTDFDYPWGDALAVLGEAAPAARIVNLETAVTAHPEPWPGKGIHYRMHPANIACLTTAGIDCCVLANNHVLDWGYEGLRETLAVLSSAGIRTAGAGADLSAAMAPAIIDAGHGRRVLVFSIGTQSSGIGHRWAAGLDQAGVWLVSDLGAEVLAGVSREVARVKRSGDIAIASIHWGGNWGYEIPAEHRRFAHALIDHAGVDLIHGHSSHHPRGMEIYHDKLVLYGCGDFLNDYEGIGGYEEFRDDLRVIYLPVIEAEYGRLTDLRMPVMQAHRFRLRHASSDDIGWLGRVLDRESRPFGARVGVEAEQLRLQSG